MSRLPGGPCVRRAEITDLYITGTRVRLREAVETTADGTTTVRKLTQKVAGPVGAPGLMTTMYLNHAEYEVIRRLPADKLTKLRLSVPPLGIDVFTGALAGLVLGEIEFESAEEEERFPVPHESVAEVTLDPIFTGGRLVTMERPELISLLAEFGLEPLDASGLATAPLVDMRG